MRWRGGGALKNITLIWHLLIVSPWRWRGSSLYSRGSGCGVSTPPVTIHLIYRARQASISRGVATISTARQTCGAYYRGGDAVRKIT
jgi:hypothetical protein